MKYELQINATIRQIEPYSGGGCLEVRESVTLNAESFLELSQVLGQFHELARKLREEKS